MTDRERISALTGAILALRGAIEARDLTTGTAKSRWRWAVANADEAMKAVRESEG